MLDNVLIIFVKYPQTGFVKTRLAKQIGEESAVTLYRLFVETILARTDHTNFMRSIFYSPPEKENQIREWLDYSLEFYPQEGNDLGERLSRAFEFTFKRGAKRVVVIGTDSPLLDKKVVLKAFKGLKNNQCVIGPSVDGGYYLLGLSCFYEAIFQYIDWGRDKVLKQTLKLVKKSKIKFSLLDEGFDVDNIADLITLKNRLPEIHRINPTGLDPIIEAINKIISCSIGTSMKPQIRPHTVAYDELRGRRIRQIFKY